MRCLVLANACRRSDIEVIFICRQLSGNLISKIKDSGYEVKPLTAPKKIQVPKSSADYSAWLSVDEVVDAQETIEVANCVDWVVVDHYGLSSLWESVIKDTLSCSILAIDDLNREHVAQVVLDQNLWPDMEARYSSSRALKLLGPEYALLRNSFSELRQSQTDKKEQILVFFGGSDPTGECLKLLEAVLSFDSLPFTLIVVTGELNPQYDSLKAMPFHPNVRVVKFINDFDVELAKSKYVIGASGVSNWERFCLRVPASVVAVADNQVELSEFLGEKGFVRYLGEGVHTSKSIYITELELLRQAWLDLSGVNDQLQVDGFGADRVVGELLRFDNE